MKGEVVVIYRQLHLQSIMRNLRQIYLKNCDHKTKYEYYYIKSAPYFIFIIGFGNPYKVIDFRILTYHRNKPLINK